MYTKARNAAKEHASQRTERYLNGGHPDAAADKALVKKMVKPAALKRADGGRTAKPKGKDKGKTQVNVIVAPQGPAGPGAQPAGLPPVGAPPSAPPAAAPAAGPGLAALGRGPAGGTPMPPRARGGKVHMTAGAGSGVGREQNAEIQRREDRPARKAKGA